MKTYILEKGFVYKLFMLLAFSIFSLVMYQGHIIKGGIYSVLFFATIALIAFQIASIFYVSFIKRKIEIKIENNKISWKFFDNKRVFKEEELDLDKIKDIKTEVNYLTGNIYSNFTITFILKDSSQVVLTDGLLYDFGLKKAEDVCRFLLDNELGEKQDIKLSKLIKEQNIDLSKEQVFTKKDGKFYYVGVVSFNKKSFYH